MTLKKCTAIFLAAVFVLSASGCSALQQAAENAKNSGKAVPGNGKWLYSEIEGTISKDTKVSEKDDFYTAVNKDWILDQKLDESGFVIELFNVQKTVDENMRILVRDPESTGYRENTTVGMDAEEIAHAGEIVADFYKEVSDTAKRDSLGVEPLRPYVEAVQNIKTVDEMADFLSVSGKNLSEVDPVYVKVGATAADPGTFRVILEPIPEEILTLGSRVAYSYIDADAIFAKQKRSALLRLILGKLGYGSEEIEDIIRRAYRFECRLAENLSLDRDADREAPEYKAGTEMTTEQAQELFGAYPIAKILDGCDLGSVGSVSVFQPKYMKAVGELFSEKYLEEIKAFYIMRTVYGAADLLDTQTAAEVSYILTRGRDEAAQADSVDEALDKKDPEDEATDALINGYVKPYVGAPFEMLYIAAFLDGTQKEGIRDLLHQVKEELRDVLANEEWMSEEGRKNTAEKLDLMAERVLFPDTYISYKGLDFTGDENLVDMAADIFAFNKKRKAPLAGTVRTRNEWDLAECTTTVVNAYNNVAENAMIIPAGIVTGSFTYDPDGAFETNLARLGTILGHEMTHGFDTGGCRYDKYGNEMDYGERDGLLTSADRSKFTEKTFTLAMQYTAIEPMPGMTTYSASVQTEAIADMGGVKCALGVAEETADFNYDLFFRSYAELWRKVNTIEVERMYAQGDVHPLAYLRTNMTLQQFDEFLKTYDVKEGDGMYLDPAKRIIIW